MGFRLVKTPVFWWPVIVRTPDEKKPGAITEQRFEMEFEALDRAASLALRDEVQAITDRAEREKREHALLERVCRNWREVNDEDGLSLPFSPETFAAAMQQSWFRAGVYSAYAEAINGEARLGN